MVRVIMIDLDGIIRRWPASDESLELVHGLPAGVIREIALSQQLIVPVTLGHLSDKRWRERIVYELRERFPQAGVKAAVEAWSASTGVVDQDVLDALAMYEPDARLVLVTKGL